MRVDRVLELVLVVLAVFGGSAESVITVAGFIVDEIGHLPIFIALVISH